MVWKNVDVLVADVAGLDGVFGMNLLLPSVTIDTAGLGIDGLGDLSNILQELQELLEELFGDLASTPLTAADEELSLEDLLALLDLDVSPMYFDSIVFDPANAELRVQSQLVPEPVTVALLGAGSLLLLRRRRR